MLLTMINMITNCLANAAVVNIDNGDSTDSDGCDFDDEYGYDDVDYDEHYLYQWMMQWNQLDGLDDLCEENYLSDELND